MAKKKKAGLRPAPKRAPVRKKKVTVKPVSATCCQCGHAGEYRPLYPDRHPDWSCPANCPCHYDLHQT